MCERGPIEHTGPAITWIAGPAAWSIQRRWRLRTSTRATVAYADPTAGRGGVGADEAPDGEPDQGAGPGEQEVPS
ncbi:hypothetical protein GCM10023147_32250 [Tsukamurella soli]|uniref:Uncharacterized protein n=1 Tax=Tsukamurella soli TaxID=644556 RepID=A0ABP8JXE4_9ACTN